MLLDERVHRRSRPAHRSMTRGVLRSTGERRRGPFDFQWCDPEFAALAMAERLDEIDHALFRADGQIVTAGRSSRETVRLSIGSPGDAGQVVYLKRECATRWKDLLRHVMAGRGLWTKCRAEFEALRKLRAAGIGVARPLVCLQQGFVRPQGCLVLEALPESQALNDLLAEGGALERGHARDEFFAALAREVARLHATGFNQPDLFANHIHAARQDAAWQFHFLDFQRSVPHERLSVSSRARDLAALWATLPRRLAGERDREMFFDSYLSAAGLEERAAELVSATEQRIERLLQRRKIWEIRESDTAAHRSVQALSPVESGRMWIDPAFRPHLERSGRATIGAMMATTDGRCLRALADRENWRITLDDGRQPPCGAFLKKHHVRTWRTRLRARFGMGPGESAGRIEARNVARLSRGGIAAMRLIAYGERLHADGLLESFVLTEELAGFTQLDHFLRRRFAAQHDSPSLPCDVGSRRATRNRRDAALAPLIRNVAGVASQFHTMGYNHRDLYCCHFFIREEATARFQVHLIDLQRVEHRKWRRRRWIVKDLAQLAYSAPRERISRTHKMAFIKSYLGVNKLRAADKRLIRSVLRKQRFMEWTLGLHP